MPTVLTARIVHETSTFNRFSADFRLFVGERAMIRERMSAGLAIARAEGRVGWRHNVRQPTGPRIVAAHRPSLAL